MLGFSIFPMLVYESAQTLAREQKSRCLETRGEARSRAAALRESPSLGSAGRDAPLFEPTHAKIAPGAEPKLSRHRNRALA
jgi:hypothetical protein